MNKQRKPFNTASHFYRFRPPEPEPFLFGFWKESKYTVKENKCMLTLNDKELVHFQ